MSSGYSAYVFTFVRYIVCELSAAYLLFISDSDVMYTSGSGLLELKVQVYTQTHIAVCCVYLCTTQHTPSTLQQQFYQLRSYMHQMYMGDDGNRRPDYGDCDHIVFVHI